MAGCFFLYTPPSRPLKKHHLRRSAHPSSVNVLKSTLPSSVCRVPCISPFWHLLNGLPLWTLSMSSQGNGQKKYYHSERFMGQSGRSCVRGGNPGPGAGFLTLSRIRWYHLSVNSSCREGDCPSSVVLLSRPQCSLGTCDKTEPREPCIIHISGTVPCSPFSSQCSRRTRPGP
jgi:hypothetical protein